MLPETWTPEYRKNVQQEIEKYKNDLKKSQYIKPSISCPNGHHYSKFTCEKQKLSTSPCWVCGKT